MDELTRVAFRNGPMREHLWWQKGIIYQIYPRSFSDSNSDGVGDLAGIMSKLEYLEWLGVDAIWLSPIYPSPMKDFGYDVSNYVDIDPAFGTLQDFDQLVGEVHRRGMKLLMDYIPNHSSDQHPWFKESRSSRSNSKRDWYLWRDPKPGGRPPNNWLSNFGGIAWTFDPETEQFYYHAFLKEQPDLNWRNPEVEAAMHEVLRFWLERGVDGFRVDAVAHVIKDEKLRDNPKNPEYNSKMTPYRRLQPIYDCDQPEIHEVIARMRGVLDEYDERVMIVEVYLPVSRLVAYYGLKGEGAHLPFNFQLIRAEWKADGISQAIKSYEKVLPPHGWPNWVLGNHDKPRVASRAGERQARNAAMLLLTLHGTPTLYYGDEIGMTDLDIPPQFVQDPLEKNVPGIGAGRDPVRTPMQWAAGENAGFSTVQPWLPVNPNCAEINVASEMTEERSLLQLHRKLIAVRRREPALSTGSYGTVQSRGSLLYYTRLGPPKSFLVVLNLGERAAKMPVSKELQGRICFSTELLRCGEKCLRTIALEGGEGLLIELEA